MTKRNDGYALAYVLVVLAVLAAVAMATMSLALSPLKGHMLTLERMENKYTAQGLVEQVIGQLEHTVVNNISAETLSEIKANTTTPDNITINQLSADHITVTAKHNNTTVTAELKLEPIYGEVTVESPKESVDENGNVVHAPSAKVITGYTITYLSYNATVEKEVAES